MTLIFLLYGGVRDTGRDNQITQSTIKREKLDADVDLSAGYYTDEPGDWIYSSSRLERGLKSFYKDTGVVPYVYIINNINGDYDPTTQMLDDYAQAKYAELFNDQAHALLMFWDYGGAYEYRLWLGSQTGLVMDSEACDILFDYLDYYYYEADTDEAFFSDAFEQAGKRIMGESSGSKGKNVLWGVLIAAIVIFVVYKLVRSKKEKAETNSTVAGSGTGQFSSTAAEPSGDEVSDLKKDLGL